MDRGLKTPLSGNEQATLRRVSYGIAASREMRIPDLLRLSQLGLITHHAGKLILTKLGTERLARLSGIEQRPTG